MALVVLLPGAPGAPPAARAVTRLESSRPGASVSLYGPLTLRGTLPMGVDLLPAGQYRLHMGGLGLASSRGRLTRFRQGQLRLGGSTGPTALFLPPGYTHLTQGEKGRGAVFLASGLGLAAGVVSSQIARSKATLDEGQADRDYANAVTEAEFVTARLNYLGARERGHDKREMRTLWASFLGYTWGAAALESWLLTPTPDLAGNGAGVYNLSGVPASAPGAMLRSLLVPGGGQRYLGHPARANCFLGATTALGSAALLLDDSYLSARRARNTARRQLALNHDPQADAALRTRLKEESDRSVTRNKLRWVAVGTTAAVYLWSVIDTIDLHAADSAPASLGLRVDPRPEGLMAGLTWRLP